MELLKDMQEQKKIITIFVLKLLLFIFIVFTFDRLISMFLKEGLERYFGLEKSSEILLIGHSHTVLGLDHNLMEKELDLNVSKYARSGANLRDRKVMIEQYFFSHPKSVKIVVYDVDAHLFTSGGLSRNSYQLFYPFMDTPIVKNYILKANPPWQELLLRELFKTSRYSDMLIAQSMRGWLGKWTNLKYGQVDTERLQNEITHGLSRKIEFNQDSIDLFKETLNLIKKHGVGIYLVYIPTIDILNEAEPLKYKQALKIFQDIANNDKKIHFLNLNEPFSHNHKLFFDPVHLNPKGQKSVTNKLIKNLKRINNNSMY